MLLFVNILYYINFFFFLTVAYLACYFMETIWGLWLTQPALGPALNC